jgi:hypothetical protein
MGIRQPYEGIVEFRFEINRILGNLDSINNGNGTHKPADVVQDVVRVFLSGAGRRILQAQK